MTDFGDRVEFFVVYIREAHPLDGHLPMEYGMVEDPINAIERTAVARRCMTEMKLPIKALVDKMDDAVNLAYSGWPERLFLVGKDGKLAYAGGPGPFGFEPDELDAALRKLVGEPKKHGTNGENGGENGGDRKPGKEPEYVAQPLYAQFRFGPRGEVSMWAVLDKTRANLAYYDVLYLDKNANGDLTDEGERITGKYDAKRAKSGLGLSLRIDKLAVPGTDEVHEKLLVSTIRKKGRTGIWFRMQWRGKVEISGGYAPVGTNTTDWSHTATDAPVLQPTAKGPLAFALYGWGESEVKLKIGGNDKAYIMVGNRGSGPDTLCAITEDYLDLTKDKLTVTLIARDKDGKEIRSRTRIKEHC